MKTFRKCFTQLYTIVFTGWTTTLWAQEEAASVAEDVAQEAAPAVKDMAVGVAESVVEVAAQQFQTAKSLIDMIIEFFVKYSFQVLGGLIVLFLGWLVAKNVANFITKLLEKKNVDVTVAKFIVGAVKMFIMVFAVIVALGKFGIEMAPFIAGISVIGIGLSFALQGPLSNYASGATLIFTKPFKVGDIIEVAGVTGEVLDLKMPRTEMTTGSAPPR